MKHQKLLLGAHISITGGLDQAIIRGESIACTAIQIFTKSNRQWNSKTLSDKEIEQFIKVQKTSSIATVVAHASYLINLASPDSAIRKKSVSAAISELTTCERAHIPFLVVHPGSYTTSTIEEGCTMIAKSINEILEQVPGKSMILLETMAGQGTVVGSSFTELALIRKLVTDHARVGICLDTCHVFAAGYNFSTPASYKKMWDKFEKEIGLCHLKVIHLNDSKKECGCKVDRHEDIGKGTIGLEGFRLLMNDERLAAIPKILETPKATLEDDAKNMAVARNLIKKKNEKE